MRKLLLLPLLAFAACEETPKAPDISYTTGNQPERFKVQKVATFQDTNAYHNKRDVFVITDTKTGREFVGVSGVGISELGSHQSGSGKSRVTVEDER